MSDLAKYSMTEALLLSLLQ